MARTPPKTARLAAHLREVIADAESELKRLGRHPQAWQSFRAYLIDTLPAFGSSGDMERLLGPSAPENTRIPIPTRALHALRTIRREVRRCRRCRTAIKSGAHDWRIAILQRAGTDQVMIHLASQHHRALYRRYVAELQKPVPAVIREMPAWDAAYRAATAAAALRNLASPIACFSAGAYLEQRRVVAWAVGTLLPRANAQARRRFADGVGHGKFPELAHAAVRRARAETAAAEQRDRKMREEPVREVVRLEHARLCAAGYRKTEAARRIVEDPDVRARIKEIARQHTAQPWRGEFYSFAAIRKIVGL